jgi:hypothetical protein
VRECRAVMDVNAEEAGRGMELEMVRRSGSRSSMKSGSGGALRGEKRG